LNFENMTMGKAPKFKIQDLTPREKGV
jgi:hypothetical protein